MDDGTFATLLDQLGRLRLPIDKLRLLKDTASSSQYAFSGDQLCRVCQCFPLSTDKKDAVEILKEQIAGDVPAGAVAQLIRSVSFSRDQLRVLDLLAGHVDGLESELEQLVLVNAFDFFIDKDHAWNIIKKHKVGFQDSTSTHQDTYFECEMEEEDQIRVPASVLYRMVHQEAADTEAQKIEASKRLSIFELPVVKELKYLRDQFPSMDQAVMNEVKRRRQSGQNFVIPSRITSITANLKPGRRLTVGGEPMFSNDEYNRHFHQHRHSALPDVIPNTIINEEAAKVKDDNVRNIEERKILEENFDPKKSLLESIKALRQKSDMIYGKRSAPRRRTIDWIKDGKRDIEDAINFRSGCNDDQDDRLSAIWEKPEPYIAAKCSFSESIKKFRKQMLESNQSQPIRIRQTSPAVYKTNTIDVASAESKTEEVRQQINSAEIINSQINHDEKVGRKITPVDLNSVNESTRRNETLSETITNSYNNLEIPSLNSDPAPVQSTNLSNEQMQPFESAEMQTINNQSIKPIVDHNNHNATSINALPPEHRLKRSASDRERWLRRRDLMRPHRLLNDQVKRDLRDFDMCPTNRQVSDLPTDSITIRLDDHKHRDQTCSAMTLNDVPGFEIMKKERCPNDVDENDDDEKFDKFEEKNTFIPDYNVVSIEHNVDLPSFRIKTEESMKQIAESTSNRSGCPPSFVPLRKQTEHKSIDKYNKDKSAKEAAVEESQDILRQNNKYELQQDCREVNLLRPEQFKHNDEQKSTGHFEQLPQQQLKIQHNFSPANRRSSEMQVSPRPPSTDLLRNRLDARRAWLEARLRKYRESTNDDNNHSVSTTEFGNQDHRDFVRILSNRNRNNGRRATTEICNWPKDLTKIASTEDHRNDDKGIFVNNYESTIKSADYKQIGEPKELENSNLSANVSSVYRSNSDVFRVESSSTNTPRLPAGADTVSESNNPCQQIPLTTPTRKFENDKPESEIAQVTNRPKVSFAEFIRESSKKNLSRNYLESGGINKSDHSSTDSLSPLSGFNVRYRPSVGKPTLRPISLLDGYDSGYDSSYSGAYSRPGIHYYTSGRIY